MTIIRKILIALIFILPAISYSGCRKQAKCGCGKDVLFNLTNQSAYVYWSNDQNVSFMIVGDAYSTYYFCNPSEMYQNLKDAKSGDILSVSGHVYWNCAYAMQASNSAYQSVYKVYDCQGTGLTLNLYGKGSTDKPVTEGQPSPKN